MSLSDDCPSVEKSYRINIYEKLHEASNEYGYDLHHQLNMCLQFIDRQKLQREFVDFMERKIAQDSKVTF